VIAPLPPFLTGTPTPPQASPFSFNHRLGRLIWRCVYAILFRPSPEFLHGWRRLLLCTFGARLSPSARVYPSARVWAPWNLEMGPHSCLGRQVDCYNVARIRIGARSTISQYSYLCGATHDYTKATYPLLAGAIIIDDDCWLGADVFVGPHVHIGPGTVIGARSSVYGDLPSWSVAVGNPAKVIKPREFDRCPETPRPENPRPETEVSP